MKKKTTRPTGLPKSPQPLADHVRALTRRINVFRLHFKNQPRHFHDGKAKRIFSTSIHRRGLALEELKAKNPELYQTVVNSIQKGGGE
ncbi:MAG: hypothetical protein A3A22_04240 [Candidatus Taylorbacteria bacterium RIFCSPLOWO2_01_FULL_45_34b]|nr:MAG: hypothetical protein A3A22_04240 [Candidatus Taylorbacteria bacterium RIFCSPLOWO2_01_FULL_45_34b]QBM02336.1 hypothetical protein [uncultured archaeon]